ncbi:hypothetical protein Pmani_031983 [Petrolisthes manimaculis]|uniref:EGF-like domain-containing protein n=1 Tax=Petrolisthes manimaculis TaxID=1843537 RepID=A0AAE1NTJ6_9EUCA|nr:hypothetical protein Pmani_031983 [Petrolisthes manimaculis]
MFWTLTSSPLYSRCVDTDECSVFRPCSQLCQNTQGGFDCSCVNGYYLRPDRLTCKAHGPRATIIFANRVDIRQITINQREYSSIAEGLNNAISLDYHYKRGYIYWTDVTLDAIKRAYLNGSGEIAIVRSGLKKPSGLTVDWVNDHVYWLDSVTRRIEVSNLDGSSRRPLIWTDLEKPRALLVHPFKRLLIWTDWGSNPKIERAYLDGSGRKVVVGEGLHWPNGITLDYPTETLYWVDAKQHVIEAAHINGSHRRLVLENLRHPFAITVFEDFLYWTDWETHSIEKVNKRTGQGRTSIHRRLTFPMDIRSFHPVRQPLPLPAQREGCSQYDNGGCSHLCLSGPVTHTCYCPHGLILLPDKRTCSQRPDQALIFAQRNNLRLISLIESEGNSTKMDTVIPVDGLRSAVALDFYQEDDLLFWSDVETKTISRAHINGTDQSLVISTDLDLPAGVAVDWVGQKLYWTDAGTTRIEVANLDGSMRSLLVWQGLDKPRDIVVDPQDRYMFWTDWGRVATIQRAGMDGSPRMVLVDSNLRWPNGLAVDHLQRSIYWVDASTNSVEMVDFSGTNRKAIIEEELSHPFGLALWGDRMFWSDWVTRTIHSADKKTGGNRQDVVKGLKELMDVRVFDRAHPLINSPCSVNNGGCSHLCLLSPGPAGFSCACPTGIMLKSDGQACEKAPNSSLVFAQREIIRQLSLDTPYLVDIVLPVPGLQHVVALDVDSLSGDIFLADSAAGVIYRISSDGSIIKAIVSSSIDTVEGITIDSTGRKIYWTDYKRQSVEVSELDGSNRLVLFTGLDRPRAITTHYPSGRLFWTDWDDENPRIEVADMDGNNRKVLVNTTIAWPNGLSVDWEELELFWTDAKLNYIQAIKLDGTARRSVVTGVPHPYGVSVLGQWVYWTDWETKSLNRTFKETGRPVSTIRDGLAGLMDVKALPGPPVGVNVCGNNNGGCSHLCLVNPRGFSCACPTGINMLEERKCKEEPDTYLIFASKGMIGRISLDAEPLWDVPLPIPGTKRPIAVDYHGANNLLFYTDVDKESINILLMPSSAVSLKNLSAPWKIMTQGFTTPDGLAVDWLADNIYWTDASRKMIQVARLDGSSSKNIIQNQLVEPRAIAVYPSQGLLFWTDWGKISKIERSFLDGSERRILLDDNMGWPNGLAIDYELERIYWNDAKGDAIGSSDFNGGNRVRLLTGVPHPFGLTLLGGFIYWTDWERFTIERADKANGGNRITILSGLEGIMEVKAVSPGRQDGYNACADRNGGCTHLCLFHPAGHRCICPDVLDARHCSDRPMFKVNTTQPAKRYQGTDQDGNRLGSRSNPKGLIPLLVVIAVIMLMLVIGLVLCTALYWKHHKKGKQVEGPKGGGFTYTNPTYSASNCDVNTDRKPFTWRRFHHHENTHQVRMFEEKGEVAALISEGSSVEHESPPPTPPTRTDTNT